VENVNGGAGSLAARGRSNSNYLEEQRGMHSFLRARSAASSRSLGRWGPISRVIAHLTAGATHCKGVKCMEIRHIYTTYRWLGIVWYQRCDGYVIAVAQVPYELNAITAIGSIQLFGSGIPYLMPMAPIPWHSWE
jgi:hypothetical protein